MAPPTVFLTVDQSILPVYDKSDGHARMYYSSCRDRDNEDSFDLQGPKPLRVLALGNYDVQPWLVEPAWPEGIAGPDGTFSVVLKGQFQPYDSPTLESEACTADLTLPNLQVGYGSINPHVQLVPPRAYLPWGLRGKICWSFTLSDGSIIQLGESPLELYFVASGQVKDCLFRGLPLELFRKFLLPLRLMTEDPDIGLFNDPSKGRTIGDDEKGWLVYVLEKLHYQKNMLYNSFHYGMNHYFNGNKAAFHLDHWVDDCGEQQKHLLNCYDLAALTDVIVRLGIQSSTAILRMKIMNPFGYINTADLIGRGLSNSPLPDNPAQFLEADPNNPRRTGFGTHVFMTIADGPGAPEMALDATCRPENGPPHAGVETLAQYITNSIDSTTTLYDASDEVLTGANRSRKVLGTLTDTNPKDWPGVTQLFTEAEVFHPDMLNTAVPEQDNILAGVAAIFPGWSVTAPNVAVNINNVTAIWSISMSDGQTMSLQISRCALDAQADELYAESKALLTEQASDPITFNNGSSDVPSGIVAAFGAGKVSEDHRAVSAAGGTGAILWTQGTFFVQLAKDYLAGDLPAYVQGLVALIGKVQPPAYQPLIVSGQTAGVVEMQAFVGSTFQIQVSGLPADMVPINVDIELAKALYLSSSKSGDTVTFTFLARAATRNVADSISFCRFDASMGQHWAQAKVAVTIQDV